MEATFITTGIILKRQPYRECDSRIFVYTAERGKLDLVARGTAKIKSKLAGHLEPLTHTSLMVVKGRQFDYIGSARSEDCFPKIKIDLEKIAAAGEVIRIFNDLIRGSAKDEKIFDLLNVYLKTIDAMPSFGKRGRWLKAIFFLKLLGLMGFSPELSRCVQCGQRRITGQQFFSPRAGGLICENCQPGSRKLRIGPEAVSILKTVSDGEWGKVEKIRPAKKFEAEIIDLAEHYLDYHYEEITGQVR